MKSLLKKMNLILPFRMELDISKREFSNRLRAIVFENNPGPYSDLDDLFQPDEVRYKGEIDEHSFSLIPKQNLLGTKISAVTKGTYQEINDKLIVEGEVNGFSYWFLVLYFFSLLFYGTIATILIYSLGESWKSYLIFTALFVAFYLGAFMIHLYYFRKSTKEVKSEVERDLFYLTRNDK